MEGNLLSGKVFFGCSFRKKFFSALFYLSLSLVYCLSQSFTSQAADYYFVSNFHSVDDGKLYRSAQLRPEKLKEVINQYGIRTIINLRGTNNDHEWYRKEIEIAKQENVDHVDISMSADRLPHRNDLIALLEAYKNSERPILVHCYAGADRTGEATAIYKLEYMDATKEEALKMLSFKYFHLSWLHPAKRYFIKDVYQGIDWVYNQYYPCQQNYKYYNKRQFCPQ